MRYKCNWMQSALLSFGGVYRGWGALVTTAMTMVAAGWRSWLVYSIHCMTLSHPVKIKKLTEIDLRTINFARTIKTRQTHPFFHTNTHTLTLALAKIYIGFDAAHVSVHAATNIIRNYVPCERHRHAERNKRKSVVRFVAKCYLSFSSLLLSHYVLIWSYLKRKE